MPKQITIPHNYRPRSYQLPAWSHMQRDADGLRAACCWHRRAGKDLFAINMIASKMMQRTGIYWHLLPTYKQGRSIVWNGKTKAGRPFLDHFPSELIERKLDNEMRVHFKNPRGDYKEGSIYQVVGTDDVNSLVGTNPVGCVFSEYSLQDPSAWRFLAPILRENGGWALFIFTPRGKNHAYELFKMADENDDWFSDLRVAGDNGTKLEDGTPVISDEQIDADRRAGMPEEMIQQEYFCSFEAPLVGAYYGAQMAKILTDGRIREVAYDPKLKVDTYWDIGFSDETAIIFCQSVYGEHRIIDYYEASGESLRHYAKTLQLKEYVYGQHYAPWDISVREFTSGRSRLEIAAQLGIRFTVTPQHEVLDGIENVRNILPMCWFDRVKCDKLIEALRSYHKEWDDKHSRFKSNPVHDWSSHGADAMRNLAWHGSKKGVVREKMQDRAVDDFQYV